MKYVPNIQKGKVKIHPKDDKFKIVSSKESSLETKQSVSTVFICTR